MSPLIYWRIILLAGLTLGVAWVVHIRAENKELVRAASENTRAIKALTERAERMEKALAENQEFDTATNRQASAGVARNESARRTDRETISIDKPWPAAVRSRVFDNPDPASGSTQAAKPTGPGER